MTRRWLTAALVVLLVLVGATVVTLARQSSATHSVAPASAHAVSCPSRSLGGTLPALVYLPPGYARGTARYPVIYFLHGLPAGPSSYTTNDFVASAADSGGHRAIVVAAQGAKSANSDREYLNWGPTEDWPVAITRDLPRCIDARFRTIRGRAGRALVGLSAGGYGAFNIGLRSLASFGAIESWGGYFEATDPDGLHQLELGSRAADRLAHAPRGAELKAALSHHPAFIGFYVGNQDSRFLADNIAFDRALRGEGVKHLFRIYPGGHSSSLWQAEAAPWLGYALAALALLR